MVGQFCEDCRFFATFGKKQQGSGQCRRYPPTVPTSLKGDEVDALLRGGVWPMVAAVSWCGEFQVRKTSGER